MQHIEIIIGIAVICFIVWLYTYAKSRYGTKYIDPIFAALVLAAMFIGAWIKS